MLVTPGSQRVKAALRQGCLHSSTWEKNKCFS